MLDSRNQCANAQHHCRRLDYNLNETELQSCLMLKARHSTDFSRQQRIDVGDAGMHKTWWIRWHTPCEHIITTFPAASAGKYSDCWASAVRTMEDRTSINFDLKLVTTVQAKMTKSRMRKIASPPAWEREVDPDCELRECRRLAGYDDILSVNSASIRVCWTNVFQGVAAALRRVCTVIRRALCMITRALYQVIDG